MTDPFVELDKKLTGHRDSPLSPEHVNAVYDACTAEDGEVTEGILHNAVFSAPRLRERRKEISGMLAQLPTEFVAHDQGGGGGWSFLNACMDRDGRQWTGLHLVMERLFLLGIATGQASFCLPREMWDVLPGGMPYLVVTPDVEDS